MKSRTGISIVMTTVLLLSLPVLYEINLLQLNPWAPVPKVLVVGSGRDRTSFASQARSGIDMAVRDFRTGEVYDLEYLDTDRDSDEVIRQRLLGVLARADICLIISCQNSPEVPPVRELSMTFRIPMLLLVATNSALTRSCPELVLRFPPSDEDQATCFVEAVAPTDTVAIIYESNNYGRGLAENLIASFGDAQPLLQFLVDEESEVTPYLLLMTQYRCNTIVYAGYYERAADLLRKLSALHYKGRVLLSDGCYSNRLPRLQSARINIELSFPTDPFPQGTEAFRGYWGYGYDAAQLAREAIYYYRRTSKGRESLLADIAKIAYLNSLPSPGPHSLRLVHKYEFSGSENRAEHFSLHAIRGGAQ